MMNKIQAKAPKYEYIPNNIMREKGLTPTAKFMFVEILNWEYRDGQNIFGKTYSRKGRRTG